jgi:proline racemase
MAENVDIELDEFGSVKVDISYGGNIYALFDVAQIGCSICQENVKLFRKLYHEIVDKVNRKGVFAHPEKPFISGVKHVEFYGTPLNPIAHAKNVVAFPPEEFDRSPCGTGTSAKMALLYKKNKLKIGEEFIHESIVGSLFRCKVLEETIVGSYPAVITEITGSAWVTGMHTFLIDPEDPFPEGFRL